MTSHNYYENGDEWESEGGRERGGERDRERWQGGGGEKEKKKKKELKICERNYLFYIIYL